MIRFCFSFFLTIVVAKWIYAEAEVRAPDLLPGIDYALESVAIPTSDTWERADFELAFEKVQWVTSTIVGAFTAQNADAATRWED